MDGTALTGWMYSTTMEDGTPGAPSVAHILDCPCRGALAPENGCKTVIGRGCVRPPPGPETAQKRLRPAPMVPAGCLGMQCGVIGPTLTAYTARDGGLSTAHISRAPKRPKST